VRILRVYYLAYNNNYTSMLCSRSLHC